MEYSPFDIRKYPTVSAKEGYAEWSHSYEDSVENEMDIRLLERIDFIDWISINTAIDLACGTGRMGKWLKSKGIHNIDGIDLTAEMLQVAKEKNTYRELAEGDILNTPFQGESYELCIEVLADEHLSELNPLYSEAYRLIKPGSFFINVGYHPHFLMNGIVTHFHRDSGEAIAIQSYVHLISDHIKAALKSGFTLIFMDEGVVDSDWLMKKPKWEKYKHRPVSFLFVWKK